MKRRLDPFGIVYIGLLVVFAVFLLWAAGSGVEAPNSLIWVLALWVVWSALSPFASPFKKEKEAEE